MKNSALLASILFGVSAFAAPVDKRARHTTTEIVTETVIVVTTVYEDEPVAQATTTPAGYFYELPASASVQPTPTPAPAPAPAPVVNPPKEEKPSSVYVAPPAPVSPAPAPPAPQAPSPAAPQPATSAYVAPPAPAAPSPAAPAPAPAPAPQNQPSTSSTTTGPTHSNVDMTIYDNNGGYGACGKKLYDTDMIVALAQGSWGASTYDRMTGESTNPNCGQRIRIDYNGKSCEATIMDLCPGCTGPEDIDLSLAAWSALGLTEKTRLKASWTKIS